MNTPVTELKTALAEDGRTVRLEMIVAGTSVGSITMNKNDLSYFIDALTNVRGGMDSNQNKFE